MTTIAQVKLSCLRYGYTLSAKLHFAQMVNNSTQRWTDTYSKSVYKTYKAPILEFGALYSYINN